MTASTLGLVGFALLFLFGFALRASLRRESHYMRWLGILDQVNPLVTREAFQRQAARFGTGMAILSGLSLVGAVLCVGFIVVELGKLNAPEVEETRWTEDGLLYTADAADEKRGGERRGRRTHKNKNEWKQQIEQ